LAGAAVRAIAIREFVRTNCPSRSKHGDTPREKSMTKVAFRAAFVSAWAKAKGYSRDVTFENGQKRPGPAAFGQHHRCGNQAGG
jgi:hypothetical protein